MTPVQMANNIEACGGTVAALTWRLQVTDLTDDDLYKAWSFLQKQWDRFEVELRAWDAILKGKLNARTST